MYPGFESTSLAKHSVAWAVGTNAETARAVAAVSPIRSPSKRTMLGGIVIDGLDILEDLGGLVDSSAARSRRRTKERPDFRVSGGLRDSTEVQGPVGRARKSAAKEERDRIPNLWEATQPMRDKEGVFAYV